MNHALRNALIPIVTIVGMNFASLLGGAVITETVFNWPGLGRLMVDAVRYRDYATIQGITLLTVAIVIAVNFAVDVFIGVIDPRLRVDSIRSPFASFPISAWWAGIPALLQYRNLVLGGSIVLVLLFAGLLAPLLAPYDPYAQNLAITFHPPSLAHLFGTDEYGRDMFSRVLYGARLYSSKSRSVSAWRWPSGCRSV